MSAGLSAGSPTLPEIREHEAEDETAAIYADIRATQRSRNVNYIWRHLATIPGALGPAWQHVKSRESDVRAFGEQIWKRSEELLAAADIGGADGADLPPGVDAVLQSYAKGNRWNLAATSLLLGRGLPQGLPPIADANGPSPSLPRLPVFEELPGDVQAMIDRLAAAGPAADSGIRPSLWLHLAVWDTWLIRFGPRFAPKLEEEAFVDAHSALLDFCGRSRSSTIDLPDAAITGLERFRCRIAEMTLVGVLIRSTSR